MRDDIRESVTVAITATAKLRSKFFLRWRDPPKDRVTFIRFNYFQATRNSKFVTNIGSVR